MTYYGLTPMQNEIVERMSRNFDLVVEFEPEEFPYIYVIRRPGTKGGVFYTSTAIVSLMNRKIIITDENYPRFILNPALHTLWIHGNEG